MARRNFNDGQEIVPEDLSGIAIASEQSLLDRILPELLLGQASKVFGSSFKVGFVGATTVSVAAGVGLLADVAQVSPEPVNRLLYNPASQNATISAAHATNNRKDIISIKAVLSNELTDTRKFKDAGTLVVSNVSMVIQKDWRLDIVVTKGIEDGSVAVPSTPAGYLKIAEVLVTAATGVVGAASITDSRPKFGIDGYDAICGSSAYCTHATLADVLADSNVGVGSRVRVDTSETISTPVALSKNNMQIDFKPGVTFSKGGSATEALTISADGVRINGGRFSGFSGGGDRGIKVNSGGDYAFLLGQRFASCTIDVQEDSGTAVVLANVNE